jgi:hypothetical protein
MCTQGTDLKRNGNFSQNEREKRRREERREEGHSMKRK